MPDRLDKYEDLIPHHRRNIDESFDENFSAEKAFDDYMELTTHTNPTLKDAYISGWNQHKYISQKMYTIDEVKEIIN
jgi:hypothetical protein